MICNFCNLKALDEVIRIEEQWPLKFDWEDLQSQIKVVSDLLGCLFVEVLGADEGCKEWLAPNALDLSAWKGKQNGFVIVLAVSQLPCLSVRRTHFLCKTTKTKIPPVKTGKRFSLHKTRSLVASTVTLFCRLPSREEALSPLASKLSGQSVQALSTRARVFASERFQDLAYQPLRTFLLASSRFADCLSTRVFIQLAERGFSIDLAFCCRQLLHDITKAEVHGM